MATIIIEIGNIHKINDSIEVLRVLESRAHPSAYESQIVADIIGILRGIQEAKSPIIRQ
jgi:hypothetical protein